MKIAALTAGVLAGAAVGYWATIRWTLAHDLLDPTALVHEMEN